MAGLTTFASMASSLAVLPAILSVTGMDRPALVTSVAISGALMTLVMALATNYPIVLFTGMGIGSFLAYNICGTMGIPWPAALGLVFYAGVLFLLLSVSGIREMLVSAIPRELKLAIPCGIGLFITLIGLEAGGIVRSNPATFITLGNVSNPSCLLVLLGIVLTATLIWWEVRGAIIISILVITALGLVIPASSGGRMITQLPGSIAGWPASIRPLFFKLDLGYLWTHLLEGSTVILAILFIDLFDNMGTLIGVCSRAGLLDKEGHLPKLRQAFMADACAAMVAACLGTSTVTSVIQSATGVEAGGRTGLTAVAAAMALVLALFLTPLILAVPAVATAPALIIMGAFMLQGINELDLSDLGKTTPAFVTIVMMPFSFSVLEGIGLGLITYVGFMVGTARAREVHGTTYALSLLFLIHYFH